MPTIYETLGQRIRTLRIERQLSQEALAAQAHIDLTSVSEIESGLRNPSLKTLHKLARALCHGCGLVSVAAARNSSQALLPLL